MVEAKNPILCGYDTDYLPDWWLLPVGILALLGGRFVSVLNASTADAASRRPTRASTTAAQVALVLAFLMLAIIWLVEALGTAHVSVTSGELEPITWYVRCAITRDRFLSTLQVGPWSHIGLWTLLIVITACYTAGHWLWSYHPDLRPRRGASTVDAVDEYLVALPQQPALVGAAGPRETMLT
jgi:hypothetical protein